MGEIGTSVNVPSWPVTPDTNSTVEVDTVPGMSIGTIVRAATINDVSAIALRLEAALSGKWIDAAYYDNITVADAAAVAAGKTLMISTAITLPSGAITLSATLEFKRSGSISKGAATSLTLASSPTGNPMHQIFSGFAAGEVLFGVSSVLAVYPEWFYGGGDYSLALQTACDSVNYFTISHVIPVILTNRSYTYNTPVNFKCNIYGIGSATTGSPSLIYTGTGYALGNSQYYNGMTMKNIRINLSTNTNDNVTGIKYTQGNHGGIWEHINIIGNPAKIHDGMLFNSPTAGTDIALHRMDTIYFENLRHGAYYVDELGYGRGHNCTFRNTFMIGIRGYGFVMPGFGSTWINGDAQINSGGFAFYFTGLVSRHNIIQGGMVGVETGNNAYKIDVDAGTSDVVTLVNPYHTVNNVYTSDPLVEDSASSTFKQRYGLIMGSSINVKDLYIRRLLRGGSTVVTSDFALSSGWGNTATKNTFLGGDLAFQLDIIANGTGIGANPTVTYTFKDKSWDAAPLYIASLELGDNFAIKFTCVASVTQLIITYRGTPLAGQTYTIRCIGFGS